MDKIKTLYYLIRPSIWKNDQSKIANTSGPTKYENILAMR